MVAGWLEIIRSLLYLYNFFFIRTVFIMRSGCYFVYTVQMGDLNAEVGDRMNAFPRRHHGPGGSPSDAAVASSKKIGRNV